MSSGGRGRLASAAVLVSLLATPAYAQEEALVFVEEDEAGAAQFAAWRARLEPATTTLAEWAAQHAPVETMEPDALAVFAELEELLMSARRSAARLEERDALRTLSRAERIAEQHLALPGMAAWYAEIELAIAITAAQVELRGLAEASLRRAASVDPARTIQAAEARPEMVEQSREAARRVATGPRGRFEVRADVAGAQVFLDDRPLGSLPRTIEAPVGPHLLRVDAPGHRSWAQIVEVLEGERAPMSVRMAPTRAWAAALTAERAARAGELEALAGVLADLGALQPPAVRVVWAGPERAVMVRCSAEGCGAPHRFEEEATTSGGAVADALRWRDAQPAPAAALAEPWWERWYIWAGAGAVLAAGIATLAALLAPRNPGPRIFEVEVDALPTR